MKNLVLALGLAITPWGGQKTLPPTTTLSTPYIQQPQPERVIHQKNIITLVDALIIVESNGNPNAHCRKEKAVGCLQIRPIMLREVNRILRKQKSTKRFSLEDRWDCGLSKEMFYIWRNWHHEDSSDEVIARCWNGGPRGFKKKQTQHYWDKVKKLWEE
tara:strand:- start:762 stop:1238 length:477 start_codon:yes stop_codon:yes gene_type:complete